MNYLPSFWHRHTVKISTIRVRAFLILMGLAIMIPMAIFAGFTIDPLVSSERDTAIRGARETARAALLEIDSDVSDQASMLRVLAQTPALLDADFNAFYAVAQKNEDASLWTLVYDATGTQLLNTSLEPGATLPQATESTHERVTDAISHPDQMVSNLVWGQINKKWAVVVQRKVVLNDGRVVLLARAVPASHFNALLANQGSPDSWLFGLFDRRSNTIARNHGHLEFIGAPPTDDLLHSLATTAPAGFRHVSRDGQELVTVVALSPVSGWSVAVGVPAAEIDAGATHAMVNSATGLTVAALIGLIMALAFGGYVTKAVALATQRAGALANGSDTASSGGSRLIEIRQLISALSDAREVLDGERTRRGVAERDKESLLESERAARTAAERENRAKDEFLAMLGHELRNPLGAMSNSLALLRVETRLSSRGSRSLQIMNRQAVLLSRIVDDLLDLARVSSGKIILAVSAIDLADVVTRAVENFGAAGKLERHDLTIDTTSVFIDGDPVRLEQVLINILDNARKYTPPGGLIRVSLRTSDREAILAVADSGSGIAPELLPYIFNVFAQGELTLDRSDGGLGIGLALVKQLVELHKGSVTAQSDGPGRGTTITIRLPRLGDTPTFFEGHSKSAAVHPGWSRGIR